jgi:V/A-type H+-transporting ATPase subunit I
MFRPKSMRKIRLIVLKSVVESMIKDLHEIGLVDIRKTKYDGLDEGRPLSRFDEFSDELLKLRGIMAIMEATLGKIYSTNIKIIDGAEALVKARESKIGEELRRLNQEITETNERIKVLEGQKDVVTKVMPFKDVDFSTLATRTIGYKIGEVPHAKLEYLKSAIARAGQHTRVVIVPDTEMALVLYEKKLSEEVEQVLTDSSFDEIELPQITTPAKAIEKIDTELAERRSSLEKVQKAITEVSKVNIETIATLIASIEVEADRAEVAAKFSSSKSVYVIEGWMIGSEYGKIESLVKKYGNRATIEDVNFGHDEAPPTVLDNPPAAEPMEFITKSYSMPNYFEIDPTIMYLIALPILYGMIVGDVVYGLLSALLASFLLKKFKNSYIMTNVSKIWLYSSIPTIIFGLIFDEWGGMTHFHLLEIFGAWTGVELLHEPLYHGLARMENIIVLVGLSAIMGMLHLAAGFIIGAINEWNHNRKHSFAKLAWIGVELGAVLALGPQLGLLPAECTMAGLVLLVLAVVIIAWAEGIVGVIEVPGFAGNILSYSRIAAVGIAGVVIAELLNEFLIPLPEQGLLAILMVPVFIVLHIVNCFVAMFEALIQGGRLNIVEFRSKFLHGGGDVFIPFALYSRKI